MVLQFLVRQFIRILSDDECIKLYAALMISDNPKMTRKQALDKATLSKRDDLRLKLLRVINYGPN